MTLLLAIDFASAVEECILILSVDIICAADAINLSNTPALDFVLFLPRRRFVSEFFRAFSVLPFNLPV